MTSEGLSTGVRSPVVSVPSGEIGVDHARLSFDNGVEHLELRHGSEVDMLLTAGFSDPLPVVWATDRGVHVNYPLGTRIRRRPGPNTIRLNARFAWSVDVHGGAADVDADLTQLDIRSVAFHAGAVSLTLRLPPPDGRRVIRLASGRDLTVERPPDVPVRIELSNASTGVCLDNRRHAATGHGLVDQTTGWDGATDKYLLLVTGSIAGLRITPRS